MPLPGIAARRPNRYGPTSGACISRHGTTPWWKSEVGARHAQVDITATAEARSGRVASAPSPVGPPQS
jgi:hypothetical protein